MKIFGKILLLGCATLLTTTQINAKMPWAMLAVHTANNLGKNKYEKVAVNKVDNKGFFPIHLAAYEGDVEGIKILLKKGAEIDTKSQGNSEETPLMFAVSQNKFEAVQYLVNNGANINLCLLNDKRTALHIALEQGFYKIYEYLIRHGADINILDEDKSSYLHHTVSEDCYSLSQLLIDKGININSKDVQGITPLYLSVYLNNYDITKLLVEKGALLNEKAIFEKAPKGITPLGMAILLKKDQKIIELLKRKGAEE